MGRHKTDLINGAISLHSIWYTSCINLKCLSKVSSKCFVIINSQNCVHKQQALKIRSHDRVSSASSDARNLLYSAFFCCSNIYFSLASISIPLSGSTFHSVTLGSFYLYAISVDYCIIVYAIYNMRSLVYASFLFLFLISISRLFQEMCDSAP